MNTQIYLDNSATTRPCAQAVEAMNHSMLETYYNPSALYAPAMHAEQELLAARQADCQNAECQRKKRDFYLGRHGER